MLDDDWFMWQKHQLTVIFHWINGQLSHDGHNYSPRQSLQQPIPQSLLQHSETTTIIVQYYSKFKYGVN